MKNKNLIVDEDGNKRPLSALIPWLNGEANAASPNLGTPTEASRARVIWLLEQVTSAVALLAAFELEHPNYDHFDFPVKSFDTMLGKIGRMMDGYPVVPHPEIAYKKECAVIVFSEVLRARKPFGEQVAVWEIVALTKSGNLNSVRQCDCGRWFLAIRADQKSCSPQCRHKAYEQTDAFKAKRRAYMRDYYKLKQSGKVR